jgi:hypothetical protein
MRTPILKRLALSVSAAALLTGCSAVVQPQSGMTPTMAAHPLSSGSGFVYVNYGYTPGTVYVYSFPALQPLFTFPSPNSTYPAGECADKAGNVFITAATPSEVGYIFEYAPGGSIPIATLSDPGDPSGCSVDPNTGNLGVANAIDYHNPYGRGWGDLAIYKGASGTPTVYYSKHVTYVTNCGFDNAGNLFADNSRGDIFELPKGSSSVRVISLTPAIKKPGQVQWDGQYITIVDYDAPNGDHRFGAEVVYRLSVSGKTAKIVGKTKLSTTNSRHDGQTWITGSMITGVDGRGDRGVGVWNYPQGSNVNRTKVGRHLYGLTVSIPAAH